MESSSKAAIKRAGEERFDLLISDIAMPEIDGYALLKAIRASKLNSDIRAIAYSGYGASEDTDRAHAAGFDVHLTKPVDVTTLLATIADLARRRTAADD